MDVAQRCGLPISRPGDRIVSPLRPGASNPSSFWVDDDFWYDFGDGRGGDCIDLLAEMKHSGDRGRAIRELARITGVQDDNQGNTEEWRRYTQQLCNQIAFWQTQLTDDDRNYLRGRGLTDQTIEALKIGRTEEGRLSIPYLKNGYVAYYITRHLPGGKYPESKYRKQKRDAYCEHTVWGLDTLDRDTDTLVIAEGAFDVISFWQEGYACLSAITGHFSRDQLPVVLTAAKKFERVLLIYDNDVITHAGERFTARMAQILLKNRIPFVVGTVPRPYKDVSEFYAAGNNLSVLLDNASDGLAYLAGTFTEFEDLEQFMFSVSRFVKPSTMDAIFKNINRFDPDALKALKKACQTAPPETRIADEILATHQLKFIENVGIYEYISNRGLWQRISEYTLNGYIDHAYGVFATSQRVSATAKTVKNRAHVGDDTVFNRNPVWNFTNGTLELDTGVFREHNPADMCSIQADYPYDPAATCPNWEQFIRDVTNDDPKVAELLQFIPGYALFQDCPHEKVFVLTGSGANGKSRYTMILEKLFGVENVTNLTPKDLTDRFSVIWLKDSILNLAGEIKSKLDNTEEAIKAIASGERIRGCYKGKDFVEFHPRSKLVFACNGRPSASDTSDGLVRRLVIIDFPMKFVDMPTAPNERQKDIHLMDRLLPELSGIFNWAYAGYRLLKQVGYFTETDDQSELLQTFQRDSNPVLVFYEETELPDYISIGELYSKYCQWCIDSGERPTTKRSFTGEFRKLAQDDFEDYRSGKERGFRRFSQGSRLGQGVGHR